MKDINTRHLFIKICSYAQFDKLVKNRGYLELQKFTCKRAPSLQNFFRENVNVNRSIYIAYDTNAKIIVGYYTLAPSCMIREYEGRGVSVVNGREIEVQKNIPCLELEKFAINDEYLVWLNKKGYDNKKIGHYIFDNYISNTIIHMSEHINFSFIILYAINRDKVVNSYKDMRFETFEDDANNIVHLMDGVSFIKDSYVEDCKFMYQSFDKLLN